METPLVEDSFPVFQLGKNNPTRSKSYSNDVYSEAVTLASRKQNPNHYFSKIFTSQ